MNKKVTTLQQAVASIKDGDMIGLGGFGINRNPMAFVHELIRQGKKDLTTCQTITGMDADMLAGAGLLKKHIYSGGSLEGRFGPIASINRAIEENEIEVEEYTVLTMEFKLLAGSLGLSYIQCNSLFGSDILKNLLKKVPEKIKISNCPFTGEKQILLQALKPDVAVIVANYADTDGNAVCLGALWDMKEMANAAGRVIILAEQIVPTEVITANPSMTTIPGFVVDMVVEVPYSCHPNSVYQCYDYDVEHLDIYAKATRNPEAVKAYIDEYVLGVKDHWEYLEKIGIRNLLTKVAKPIKGY